jgi:hypothetical protein
MKKIYRESFGFFLSSLPALLLFAAVIEGLFWILQPKSEVAGSFVALTFVAYYIHRHFLFGETLSFRTQKPSPGAPAFKFGWFMLVSAGLIFVPIGIGLALATIYLDRPSTVAMLMIFLPIYLITLSLFGTALPASVARDNTYRVSQGLRATFATMWRLVLGPGVVGFVILLTTIFAGNALGSLGVTEEGLVTLGYYTLIRTLGFLTTIIAVAVLCEMYRRTRPGTRVGPDPGPADHTSA